MMAHHIPGSNQDFDATLGHGAEQHRKANGRFSCDAAVCEKPVKAVILLRRLDGASVIARVCPILHVHPPDSRPGEVWGDQSD